MRQKSLAAETLKGSAEFVGRAAPARKNRLAGHTRNGRTLGKIRPVLASEAHQGEQIRADGGHHATAHG